MAKNLVIVESPAKASTISKYLGKDFDVLASYGHVRDLIPKEGAVDTENGFSMKYQIIERNEKHVKAIIRALKKADALYLATDPDREGEAISWHLTELLREKKALDGKPVHRVVFHEITKNAVREAIAQPRDISNDLVGAQQARRAFNRGAVDRFSTSATRSSYFIESSIKLSSIRSAAHGLILRCVGTRAM